MRPCDWCLRYHQGASKHCRNIENIHISNIYQPIACHNVLRNRVADSFLLHFRQIAICSGIPTQTLSDYLVSRSPEVIIVTVNFSIIRMYPNNTITPSASTSTSSDYIAGISPELEYYLKGVLLPIIGLCGVVGNLLNLVVLSWRYKSRGVDVLEKGALLGLIALAVSDLFFCLGLLPYLYYYTTRTMFYAQSLQMYHQMYAAYYHNLFLRISSWLTLLVALARYVVICHPFQARIFIGLSRIRFAIVFTYIFWILFLLPMLWTYSIQEYTPENSTTMYIVDHGYFAKNHLMKMTFMYMWNIFGFAIPVVIVTYCNIRFIFALRESMKLHAASVYSHKGTDWDYTVRITTTLIALIVAFVLLVVPSDILHFYSDVIEAKAYLAFEVAVVVTNILQAINFAFHFLLYCAVNVTFRRTLVGLVRKLSWCKDKHPSDQVDMTDLQCDRTSSRRTYTTRFGQSSMANESFV